MTEAQFMGTLIVGLASILSLFAMVCSPLIKNAKAMVELNLNLKELNKNLIRLETNNAEAHKELWEQINDHDDRIIDHETRIHDIERGMTK